MQLNVIA